MCRHQYYLQVILMKTCKRKINKEQLLYCNSHKNTTTTSTSAAKSNNSALSNQCPCVVSSQISTSTVN